ncbi:hypothetical protein BSKO_00044 [Bryopsis sp. KO-2023]|nr:hypothetical protein BSKO_00044 [Bryopsis sp. KO-2023]
MGDSSYIARDAPSSVDVVSNALDEFRLDGECTDGKWYDRSSHSTQDSFAKRSVNTITGENSSTTVGWAGGDLLSVECPHKQSRAPSTSLALRLSDEAAPLTSSNQAPQVHSTRSGPRGVRSSRGRWRGDPRRGRAYRKLWEQVTKVGSGEGLVDGKLGVFEMSVEDIVRLVQSLPPDTAVGPKVSQALCYLDSRATAALLKELAKVGKVQRAVELFDWLRALDTRHELTALCDVYTYTTAISLCGHQKELRRALELLAEQRNRGVQCNVHTYSALMNVCIKSGELDLALDVFKQLRAEGCKPNVVTYNTLIDVYGKLGQWRQASEVLVTVKAEGVVPEIRTYNTALIACNMCNQPLEALKVYDLLIGAGLQPSATTCTALISAYGKAGLYQNAFDTYDKMVAKKMERSIITYTALMTACEKLGDWEKGLQFFRDMQSQGCQPTTVLYNSLISVVCQAREWKKANAVFDGMKLHHCKPDNTTLMHLLNAYDRCGEWIQVSSLFDEVHRMGLKLDSSFYHAVIDMLWCSGVTQAQAKAVQIFTGATKTSKARVGLQSNQEIGVLEVSVQPIRLGVAVIGLHKWLIEVSEMLGNDSTYLLNCDVSIVIGRGRNGRESACKAMKDSLLGMFQALGAPFRSCSDDGRVVPTLECSGYSFRMWLQNPDSFALVKALVCSDEQEGLDRGDIPERLLPVDEKFREAYGVIVKFEETHRLNYEAMGEEYVQVRSQLVAVAGGLGHRLGLKEETIHDAVLLMDRVMSTGARFQEGISTVVVAALIRIAAEASEHRQSIPTPQQMDLLAQFPMGSVQELENQIEAALGYDTAAISALRVTKLYMEWLGYEAVPEWSAPAAIHIQSMLSDALSSPAFLNFRPSVLAAAILYHDRSTRGWVPYWPTSLAQITGYGDVTSPEMRGAIHAIIDLEQSNHCPRNHILALTL